MHILCKQGCTSQQCDIIHETRIYYIQYLKLEDEDGNDEHASSITEWPLNRERNNRRLGVCVSWLCAFVHVQSPQRDNICCSNTHQ